MVMSKAIFPASRACKISSATFANREPAGHLDLGVEPRDLIERHPQRHFRKVTIFDVNGRPDDSHVARLEFGQELGRQHICAAALFIQIHQQIEMKIDQSGRVKAIDSSFDFSFRSGHRAFNILDGPIQGMDAEIVVAFGRLARKRCGVTMAIRTRSQTAPIGRMPGSQISHRESAASAIRQ